jgi:hypothetical protein
MGSRFLAAAVAACAISLGAPLSASAVAPPSANCLAQAISEGASTSGREFGLFVVEEQAALHPFGRNEVSGFAQTRGGCGP